MKTKANLEGRRLLDLASLLSTQGKVMISVLKV
jgi:hypothetical protein